MIINPSYPIVWHQLLLMFEMMLLLPPPGWNQLELILPSNLRLVLLFDISTFSFYNWYLFYSIQVSKLERGISLAFSIIAHGQFSLLETLIASLFRPHNSYCIFVDAKSTEEFKNMVQQLVKCYKYKYPQVRS